MLPGAVVARPPPSHVPKTFGSRDRRFLMYRTRIKHNLFGRVSSLLGLHLSPFSLTRYFSLSERVEFHPLNYPVRASIAQVTDAPRYRRVGRRGASARPVPIPGKLEPIAVGAVCFFFPLHPHYLIRVKLNLPYRGTVPYNMLSRQRLAVTFPPPLITPQRNKSLKTRAKCTVQP